MVIPSPDMDTRELPTLNITCSIEPTHVSIATCTDTSIRSLMKRCGVGRDDTEVKVSWRYIRGGVCVCVYLCATQTELEKGFVWTSSQSHSCGISSNQGREVHQVEQSCLQQLSHDKRSRNLYLFYIKENIWMSLSNW
jgi:hypothetical protein